MIAVLRSDIRRLRSRRAVLGVAIAIFGLLVLIDGIQYAKAKPRTQEPQQTVFLASPPPETCVIERTPTLKADANCIYQKLSDGKGIALQTEEPGQPAPTGTRVELFAVQDNRPKFAHDLHGRIGGWGVGLTLAALVIGSTFIGGDFGTSLTGQMVFEPRRRVVFFSKAIAAATVCIALSLAVLALDAIVVYATASSKGVVGTMSGSWWLGRFGDLARVFACIAGGAFTGFGLTMLLRRTAASVGVYLGSGIALQFLTSNEALRPLAKFVPMNALIYTAALPTLEAHDDRLPYHSHAVAAIFFTVWCVIALLVGMVMFDRREVR